MPRKAINFDLSTKVLKEHFSNTAKAYAKIKVFLLENGFEHSQYSGYISKKSMSEKHITNLAKKMALKFEWLESCVLRFHATDLPSEFDLTHLFSKSQAKTLRQKSSTTHKRIHR